MVISYNKIYYKVYLKILSGYYSEKDKKRFDQLCSWLMMEEVNYES